MESNEKFIRWQTVLRDQLTFLNSLLLTISIGIVGFIISLLINPQFLVECLQKLLFTGGFILILISVIAGIGTAFSRLQDFRTTTKKIRQVELGANQNTLEEFKVLMKLYGKTTWSLFYTQITTLGFGSLSLIIAICFIYKEKLF